MRRLIEATLAYLLLPRAITPVEAAYLRKTNRIALVFFLLHFPLLVAIAWVNDTRPLDAAILTAAVLAGPALAHLAVPSPRLVSVIYGVTAMAMGALLVHFGQGPVQIEMHFYFFALIAMLALFGNPMVIIAAASTVALHHLALWFLFPRSVFNYEAPVWVVGVHTAFVAVESIATCYIARTFFDRVIGLEKIVRARTDELAASEEAMRLILDNVEQGFATIDRAGRLAAGRSAALERWFGVHSEGSQVFDLFHARSPSFAARSRWAWSQVASDLMPLAITLDQMPRELEVDGSVFEVVYRPIGDTPSPERFLVIVADVSLAKARARADVERREAMHILERMLADRSGLLELLDEASALVALIAHPEEEPKVWTRAVHTLKGNAALFGLESIADHCQEIEDWMAVEDRRPASLVARLASRWERILEDTRRMTGGARRVLQIEEEDHAALQSAVRAGAPKSALLRMLHEWKLEPAQHRLQIFREHAIRVAARLDKTVDVRVDGHGIRLDPKRWAGFWSAFVHAVRNAVDHGIEPVEARLAAGKPAAGQIAIATNIAGDELVITMTDDGPGIDWEAVSSKAQERGLPIASDAERAASLFCDGVSTALSVTEISGRGVGMGALLEAARAMGGRLDVRSERSRGTTLRFVFPASALEDAAPASFDRSRLTRTALTANT